jgi:tetratricopeptide (TPR) repeat protein
MMKTRLKVPYTIGIMLFILILSACTSPEEKAAEYIESASAMLANNEFKKAEIEYKNALQINQNLPDALYGLAKIYERRNQWSEAYAVLNKIRELNPQHVEGRLLLGRLLLASNQLDQALIDAREIMALAPEDARAHSLMASVQALLDNQEVALDEAAKALAIDPGNSDALLVQARVFLANKEFDSALQLLDKSISNDPDNASLYLMKLSVQEARGDNDAVVDVYLSLIEQFPGEATYKRALARHYVLQNNIDGAEKVLLQLVESEPDNVSEKLRLVAFKYQNRSTKAAIEQIHEYIGKDRGDPAFLLLLGELYERNEQPRLANKVYREIIAVNELQASGLEARNKLAAIEMREKNTEEATALIDEVLTQDIANKNALLLLVEMQIAEQKYDDALLNIRKVLRDNPDSLKALDLLGQTYEAMGSQELAIESYHKALQLYPGEPSVANRLARIYIASSNHNKADEILSDSIAHGNRSLEAIQMLAQAKLALGKWEQAELLLKELQNVEGLQAISQQSLGVVYLSKGEQDASIEAFKRAHELAPASNQPVVSLVLAYLRTGKVEEARQFLETIISENNDNYLANLLLARINVHNNNVSEAIALYNKLIAINPEADSTYHELAEVYIRQKDPGKAEIVIQQGLSALPGLPSLSIDLASIKEIKGETDEAIKIYQSLLNNNPDLLIVRNNLASLLTDNREDDDAHRRAREIAMVLKDSKVSQFRDTYAWASIKAGVDLEEAIEILEVIVSESRQVDVYNYHLGEAYRKQGRVDLALNHLQKAVDLAPAGSPVAKQAGKSLQQLSQ